MTHLRIELNTITENVTSNVIHKLYETAKAIIDAEEANDVQESLVSLKGNLLVSKAYGDEIDWLEAKFPDLHITAGARYIRFADPAVYARLSLYLGDGTGITSSEITNANVFSSSADPKTNQVYFANNTDIVSFNELGQLPQVTNIPDRCFEGCTNLTSIDLQNVSNIGFLSFRGANLTGVINLPSLITITGRNTFTNCTNITEVNFNLSVFTGFRGNSGIFEGCTSLLKVTGLGNITEIPQFTFSGANSLVSVDCTNMSTIGNNAFRNCTSLTSVDLSSCVSIGQSAFLGCTGLTSVDLSAYTAGTALSCFEGCTSLTSVTLPSTSFAWGNNIKNHKSMFYGCTSLASIDMSNATFIGNQYFQGCTALTTCIWPTSVTTIPDGCFNGCTNLESLGSKISPTQVNYGAFSGCNKLTLDDINLSSIVTIENKAFKNSGISGVVNLTNCTYIGESAFDDCAVTEIHGPNVTSINLWSIYSLPTLLVLDLPVCSRCPTCTSTTSLTTLNVPSATSFGLRGDLSLTNCRNLTTLNIPFENFIGVMDYAFLNCVGLSGQTFDFGTDLQYIGIEAFMNTSINIVLRGSSVVPAKDRSFVLYSGLIYVPDELVETYKTSTGYSSVSSQIKGISELPST